MRTNITPPQREESPESRRLFGAGLGARSPQRTPRGKHGKANALTPKRTLPRRQLRSPFSVPRVLWQPRRDRHKETAKPEVNPQRQITAPTSQELMNGDLDPAEQERKIPQAVLFGARRQTAGVIERKTPQEERATGLR